MKKILPIFAIVLLVFHQNNFAQCTAVITNVPHGECEESDIELSASGGGTSNGYSYEWTGPQGYTSTSQFVSIPHAFAASSGIYKVSITDPSGCRASDSLEVIKHPNPQVYTGGDAGGCLGGTTFIFANDYSGNYAPYTYLWDNGTTSQTLAITHGGGMYPAPACVITNMYGCSASNNTTFLIYTVSTPESPVIEALGATTFCEGGSVNLTTNYNSELTYQWLRKSFVISDAVSNNYTAKSWAKYSLSVTNSFGCSAFSNSIHVIVNQNPVGKITVSSATNICNGDSLLLSLTAGNGITYQWKKHGLDINGAASSSYYAHNKGYYRVLMTNGYGCTKLSNVIQVTENCRLEEKNVDAKSIFSIYPNPSNTGFNLTISPEDLNNPMQIIILEMTGRIIRQQSISEEHIQFGEDLPAGIYNVRLINGSVIQSGQIVKTE
jgi:hypothetical protein